MITAVDTNILLDVLVPGAHHADASERALAEAIRGGAIIISELVYAELAAHFQGQEDLERFLSDTGIRLRPSGPSALFRAGQVWITYARSRSEGAVCPRCGVRQELRCRECGGSIQPRQHVISDFVIGAHALEHANKLLTRDRGYYATYFPQLSLG